jgi:PII-like signaling protein
MTFRTHPAVRLTVLVDDTDTWHHKPVCSEIVHRAHRAGLRGASIFHGVEGFGSRQIIHTTRLLSLADDLPVAVVIVDTDERIQAFLPQLEELGIEGLITLEPVRTVHFGDDTPAGRP